jgi:hypothetical protein
MSMRTKIIGNSKEYEASVSSDGFLRVDTRDYYDYTNAVRYFVNDTYGDSLNVNGNNSGGGSITELIYDGDNAAWSPSIISSTSDDFTFPSTTENHTSGGSASFEYATSENGDTAQFLRSGYLDLTPYNSLTGWIYLTRWQTNGTKQILFYGYDTTASVNIGIAVDLGNYINKATLNAWQSFTIPLSDMNLTDQTIDAVRTQVIDVGSGGTPRGFLDDFKFSGNSDPGSGPATYTLEPNTGEILIVDSYCYTLANSSSLDTTLANGTMPKLSWNKLLGVTLTNGINYRRFNNGVATFTANWKNLLDIISSPGAEITNYGADATSAFISVNYKFAASTPLKYSERDSVKITINDDLSAFGYFKVSANCRIATPDLIRS